MADEVPGEDGGVVLVQQAVNAVLTACATTSKWLVDTCVILTLLSLSTGTCQDGGVFLVQQHVDALIAACMNTNHHAMPASKS